MKRHFIVLSCIFFVFGCDNVIDNSEFGIPHELVNCFEGEDSSSIITNNICSNTVLDSSRHCALEIIDEDLKFTSEELSWFPAYCCFEGQKIFYENENGERISLVLERKFFLPSKVTVQDFSECPDESMSTLYCGDTETVILTFNSIDLSKSLSLTLDKKVQVFNGEIFTGAQIEAILTNLPNDTFFYAEIFKAYVVPGNLDIDVSFEFDDELEILGQTFENVYSSSSIEESVFTIFYNKNEGLVAFTDEEDELWRIIL